MRILKYFLLLLLLSALSLAVFIVTQSGEFKVTKTFTLDAPQTVIYEYIHNIDNWNDWMKTSKKEQATYEIEIDKIGTYAIRQEYSHPYDSLSQDILKDQKVSNIIWKLSPNGKKTNVTFSFQSDLDLQTKILTFFSGSPNEVASAAIDKNVNALIVYFIKQYKNYEIETTGIKTVPSKKYLYVSTSAKLSDFELDIVKLEKKLRDFCAANQVTITGNPFLILNNKLSDDVVYFDYAIPIKEKLFLNEEEMFKLGTTPSETYFEAKFSGHYTHLKQGLIEINHAISRGEASVVLDKKIVLGLTKSSADSKRPAEWQTVFYIPIVVVKAPPAPTSTYRNDYHHNRSATDSVSHNANRVIAEPVISE